MRDYSKSVNIVAMNSMKSSDSWNFFEKTLANRAEGFVPADENGENDQMFFDTIVKSMVEGHGMPFMAGVGQVAIKLADGTSLPVDDSRVLPWQVEFELHEGLDVSQWGITKEKELDANGDQVMFYD